MQIVFGLAAILYMPFQPYPSLEKNDIDMVQQQYHASISMLALLVMK